ncbi:MAG TPA: histone deacetylase [Tepidisphaeraceae bacterium]|jgi:histone deacetylase 11|nr:histone deacetylase [Tepidisphaeraceae bacterium]
MSHPALPEKLSPRIVYSPRYNIGLFGMERLHPFDSRKYGRAWNELRTRFGTELRRFWVKPPRPVSRPELLRLHTKAYLDRLRDPKFVARVLEVPPAGHLPGRVLDWCVLRPMRWATMGTVVAAREALEHGLAVNLSGGYHHANPDNGHGFSAYADVGLALHELRHGGQLDEKAKVVYVDLDAHQGNGVCRTFIDDSRVFIYDQYNQHIFPQDLRAQRRIDCDMPMPHGCHEADYLAALRGRLPLFLDSVTRGGEVRLGIYNAGTDVYTNDQLGGMNVSAAGVLERDRYVLQELTRRGIPTLVVLSGGYSRESYRLVADMVAYVLETWGNCLAH